MDNEVFLNEVVQVVAVFDNSLPRLRPVRFKRSHGEVIEVREIGLRHPAVHGHKTWHIFDITDGQSEYRLEFDSENLVWRLTRQAVYE